MTVDVYFYVPVKGEVDSGAKYEFEICLDDTMRLVARTDHWFCVAQGDETFVVQLPKTASECPCPFWAEIVDGCLRITPWVGVGEPGGLFRILKMPKNVVELEPTREGILYRQRYTLEGPAVKANWIAHVWLEKPKPETDYIALEPLCMGFQSPSPVTLKEFMQGANLIVLRCGWPLQLAWMRDECRFTSYPTNLVTAEFFTHPVVFVEGATDVREVVVQEEEEEEEEEEEQEPPQKRAKMSSSSG